MRTAEIIAIGSELLLGGHQDRNSVMVTDKLAAVGIEVRFKTVVGDSVADIVAALRIASRRAQVVVLTGGLGPTFDDCTRRAIARATRRPLRRHAEVLEDMRQRLAVQRRRPTTAQLRQALVPSGACMLPNPAGSAPGFCLKWKRCVLYAVPGVTAEAELMVAQEVIPRLLAGSERGGAIECRLLHTFGLSESDVERKLQGLVRKDSPVRLGLLASPLGVTISLTGSRSFDRRVRVIRSRLGLHLYGEGAQTMEEVVGRLLVARGLTLAVAESCTGGLIGHRLTEVPGSSGYVDRVAVCYSNRAKMELLGVPESLIREHGAVSPEVAAAMARGIRDRSGTSLGLSVTGIAGPTGSTLEKPVGLIYVGFAWNLPTEAAGLQPQGHLTGEYRLHGQRSVIKLRASQAALGLLYRWLMDPMGVERA